MYKMNIMKTDEKKLHCDILCGQIKCIIRMAYRTWQREELEPEDVKEKMIALLDKNKDSYK